MPSQAQLQWSRLRVGITVIVAMITLIIVIFLMSSSTGFFTNQIYLKTYFDNAEGLRRGAPVRLQGVDIGNVTRISVDPSKPSTPVEGLLGSTEMRVTFPISTPCRRTGAPRRSPSALSKYVFR